MTKDTADILVFPPLASVVAPVSAAALQWLVPITALPAQGMGPRVVGVALILVAGALAVTGARAFKRAKTNIDPRQPTLVLVKDGPFRFTRNPMYLGMVTLNLGLTLALSMDWGLITTPILALVLHFGVILREETYLTRKFGVPYERYLKRTRRWL